MRGELWIKGPNVVRGYWNKPDETEAMFTEGWLHSGDVARVDEEGFVYIVDRAKDIVIRGGENVYSVEVEATLFDTPRSPMSPSSEFPTRCSVKRSVPQSCCVPERASQRTNWHCS